MAIAAVAMKNGGILEMLRSGSWLDRIRIRLHGHFR